MDQNLYFQKRDCLKKIFNLNKGLTQPLALPLHSVLRLILDFVEEAEEEEADFVDLVGFR